MLHFFFDGLQGFRSRFDDLELVHEFLEELPHALELRATMPPFLLPYYNGVEPEDCGISSFMFLAGGHATLHTFSFREAFFFDLVYPRPFDIERVCELLARSFPCAAVSHGSVERGKDPMPARPIDIDNDFGPHYFLDVKDYRGPTTMDGLFDLFDRLPAEIGMTPIMRPYLLRSRTESNEEVLSAMTMIAESHISMHLFADRGVANIDLFSCRFFPPEKVLPVIRAAFPAALLTETLASRGSRFRQVRTGAAERRIRGKAWLNSIPSRRAGAIDESH